MFVGLHKCEIIILRQTISPNYWWNNSFHGNSDSMSRLNITVGDIHEGTNTIAKRKEGMPTYLDPSFVYLQIALVHFKSLLPQHKLATTNDIIFFFYIR